METKPDSTLPLLADIVRCLDDKKAGDLRVLKVGAQSSITDYLVLATGTSEPHLRALRVELEKAIDLRKAPIAGMDSGEPGSGWTVVDAYQIMVHLFTADKREQYRLENLWKDAQDVSVQRLLHPDGVVKTPAAAPAPSSVATAEASVAPVAPPETLASTAAPVADSSAAVAPKRRAPLASAKPMKSKAKAPAKPKAKPTTKAKAKVKAKSKAKTATKAKGSKASAAAARRSPAKSPAKTASGSKTKAKVKAKAKPTAAAKTRSSAKAKVAAKGKVSARAGASAKGKTSARTQTAAKVKAKARPASRR
jgi:ribosome-associated protein